MNPGKALCFGLNQGFPSSEGITSKLGLMMYDACVLLEGLENDNSSTSLMQSASSSRFQLLRTMLHCRTRRKGTKQLAVGHNHLVDLPRRSSYMVDW